MNTTTTPTDFWKSAGLHLLERNESGWLKVTPGFIAAYLTRPEVHPIEESSAAERALHDALMGNPARPVGPEEIEAIEDVDTRENYRVVIEFRNALLRAGTVEGAYLDIINQPAPAVPIPPVFLDQMVHVILRNALSDVTDPIRLRAAEVFFRDQSVSTEDGRIMMADEEIVGMHASAGETGLSQLLSETGTPMRQITLDVLDEDNKVIYWDRSDRFDTVVDLRFGEPALDALARVIERWLAHMMHLDVRVEPRQKIEDPDWRWHIGLDRTANSILNKLYEGGEASSDEMMALIALFRMRMPEDANILERVRGKPVYLALATSSSNVVKMKPQNLLTNLPLAATS